MKINLKSLIKPVCVLFLTAALMAALLSGTNMFTKQKISAISQKNELEAVKRVIPAKNYEKAQMQLNQKTYTYFTAISDGSVIGYAFSVSSDGYGGTVSAVTGIDNSGEITAVEVTDVSGETPGLGQNAKNAQFESQFNKKSGSLSVVKSNPNNQQVQAVTGATITSKAVTNAVNTALELFNSIKSGGDVSGT